MQPTSNTCIVVVKDKDGKLVFGADRRCSWGMQKMQEMPGAKITKRDKVILAGTGDAYLCDLIVKYMPIPKRGRKEFVFDYVMGSFYNAVVACLQKRHMLVNSEVKNCSSSEILIGISGELFSCCVHEKGIHINRLSLPYATGCGGLMAWGALLALNYMCKDDHIENDLRVALSVAAKVSPGCDDNLDIIKED